MGVYPADVADGELARASDYNALKNAYLGHVLSGAGTITAGNIYVDVTHGVGSTPDINKIQINLQDDLGGRGWWISNVGATTFRINISGMDIVNHIFGWSYPKL